MHEGALERSSDTLDYVGEAGPFDQRGDGCLCSPSVV